MSAVVKLGSKLPADFEMNGLDALAENLIEDPLTLRCAVVWFDSPKFAVDNEQGITVPLVQLRRFEPLGNADDVTTAIKEAVNVAIEKRTGRRPIPWDITEITEDHRHHEVLEGTD